MEKYQALTVIEILQSGCFYVGENYSAMFL